MDTAQFLRAILPTSGLYVIGRLIKGKFRHTVCDTIDEAAAYALNYDSQGVAVYHACASFREREVTTTRPDGKVWRQVRTHKNVQSLRSFFMDLDVGPDDPKKYESQEAAIIGLVDFCQVSGLPIPMVVSSGNGVHIYWRMNEDLLPETWKQTAEGLKALAAAHGLKTDSACTSDSARILRPVGTTNRKCPTSPQRVELVADSPVLGFTEFNQLVLAGTKAIGIKPPEAVRQVEAKVEVINQVFAIQREFPPCSGEKVATRCKQLARMRDTRGCISEPHWYACIQLLCHATEGDELIHRWSNGYDGYSAEETTRKILQVREQSLGPTLCTTFESRSPDGCNGCPFLGKISSPAQLGTSIEAAPAPVIEVKVSNEIVKITLPSPPAPFTRGVDGGIYIEEEGITHKIYAYDCYPVELAYDEQLGFETTRIRHFMPQEGWKECTIRSSLIARPSEFEAALRDNHIRPLIGSKFRMYFDSYIRKLSEDDKLRTLFKSQGWKENDTAFVLGERLYQKDKVIQAGYSHGAAGFLEHFHTKGDLELWRILTTAFDTPGFEPHAFMLLVAFAAPLLKLAGRTGFTICALGKTGTGKSTMGQFLASVYGHPTKTWGGMDDTQAARYERLGAYHSIPVYVDEASTIDPEELRMLVYSVATGKGRASLKQDRTLRPAVEWETVLVTSTNDSLQAKLQVVKQNAEAESMRLFEFNFPKVEAFGAVADIAPPILRTNYGVAGAKYIEYIVNNAAHIKSQANELILATRDTFGIKPEERFWAQAVALSVYGGQLAREAGVIDFNPARIRPWLQAEVQRMRTGVAESMSGAIAILSQYLNEHVGERLVVRPLNSQYSATHVWPSRGKLTQRYEPESKSLWFDSGHIKNWCTRKHFGFPSLRDELQSLHVLLKDNALKALGTGTDYAGGSVRCWMIRTDHPELNLGDGQ